MPSCTSPVQQTNNLSLQVLNRAVFPINYPERVYKDVLAFTDVTQLAYHNDVLVGAIACRLEKAPQVGLRWGLGGRQGQHRCWGCALRLVKGHRSEVCRELVGGT